MSSAAFFGHREFYYAPYREKIQSIFIDLIERYGVTKFYSGFRGGFDEMCAEIVFSLKERYPKIRNFMILSYHPRTDFFQLPTFFDETIYLLEKSVPPRYAISYTNRKIVDRVDYVVSGVKLHSGGAYSACDYARRRNKMIISIFDDPLTI